MLYVFKLDTYVKLGYSNDVWRRAVFGFQAQVHPSELCNRLTFKHLELLNVWACGDETVEKALHRDLACGTGEFYEEAKYSEILEKVGALNLEALSLPPRPTDDEADLIRLTFSRTPVVRPCCSGNECRCPECGKALSSWKQMGKHRLTHHPPQHRCECGRSFARKDKLQAHRRGCRQRSR